MTIAPGTYPIPSGSTLIVPGVVPPPPPSSPVPQCPASLNAPTMLALNENFDEATINRQIWTPNWFGDGNKAQNTVVKTANSVLVSGGLQMTLAGDGTGALISSTLPAEGSRSPPMWASRSTPRPK